MKSLDQERAAFAWKCVKNVDKTYADLAKGAPALIMGNGLMQTLAFFEQKGDKAKDLAKHIREWLNKQMPSQFSSDEFIPFMNALHDRDSDIYMQATEEAMEFLRWVRQLASAALATKG